MTAEAWKVSRATGLPGPYQGQQDAFRHCYWSCRLSQNLSAADAETVTDTHEQCSVNDMNDHKMDFHNNRKGHDAGARSGTDCKEECLTLLSVGQLIVILD